MIVDQADVVAAPAVTRGPWPRPAAPDHAPWPDAPRMAAPRLGSVAASGPVAAPGLAGLWPAAHTGTPRTARMVLSAQITAPKSARDFAHATLREWGLSENTEDVTIAVSELVTNALRHGMQGLSQPMPTAPIQIALLGHPRRLLVVVTDPGQRTPEPLPQDPDRFGEGGRGLLVVGAISDTWGWARLATGGKAVWAAFSLS